MKKFAWICFSILMCLFILSGVAEEKNEADMPEASWCSREIVELPEEVLDSDTVKCFELLSDGSFILSEANRFVITNATGCVLSHGELAHPNLKDEASEIRGIGATENSLLFAVYDYQSNSSYLAEMHLGETNINYLALMDCCISSATVNEGRMLLVGEIGVEKRSPWASVVALDGTVLWQYVDTSLENSKTNITHRVEAGEENQNVVYLLVSQTDKVDKEYFTHYELLINDLNSGRSSKMLINSSGAINTIQQLVVDEECAWILCKAYEGAEYYPTVLRIDLSTGEQAAIPCHSAKRIRQLLISGKNVVLNTEYEDCAIISTWDKSGEYIAGVKYPRESEQGRMTLLHMLEVKDRLWAVGVLSRLENGERIRTTFLVPVE